MATPSKHTDFLFCVLIPLHSCKRMFHVPWVYDISQHCWVAAPYFLTQLLETDCGWQPCFSFPKFCLLDLNLPFTCLSQDFLNRWFSLHTFFLGKITEWGADFSVVGEVLLVPCLLVKNLYSLPKGADGETLSSHSCRLIYPISVPDLYIRSNYSKHIMYACVHTFNKYWYLQPKLLFWCCLPVLEVLQVQKNSESNALGIFFAFSFLWRLTTGLVPVCLYNQSISDLLGV